MASPDFSSEQPLITGMPSLPPEFAYWAPCGEEATFWMTRKADPTSLLIPVIPVYENPAADIFALSTTDRKYPKGSEPHVNIIVAQGSENRETLGLLEPSTYFVGFSDFDAEGVINPGRVDVVIKSPEQVLTIPGLLESYLGSMNKDIYRKSWTEQFLDANAMVSSGERLLAHVLVDTALAITANTLTAHAVSRAYTTQTPRTPSGLEKEQQRNLARSKRICECLHGIFCKEGHIAADIA